MVARPEVGTGASLGAPVAEDTAVYVEVTSVANRAGTVSKTLSAFKTGLIDAHGARLAKQSNVAAAKEAITVQ